MCERSDKGFCFTVTKLKTLCHMSRVQLVVPQASPLFECRQPDCPDSTVFSDSLGVKQDVELLEWIPVMVNFGQTKSTFTFFLFSDLMKPVLTAYVFVFGIYYHTRLP